LVRQVTPTLNLHHIATGLNHCAPNIMLLEGLLVYKARGDEDTRLRFNSNTSTASFTLPPAALALKRAAGSFSASVPSCSAGTSIQAIDWPFDRYSCHSSTGSGNALTSSTFTLSLRDGCNTSHGEIKVNNLPADQPLTLTLPAVQR
jgi:hypothetical protein